jgi:Ran-binding protein 1
MENTAEASNPDVQKKEEDKQHDIDYADPEEAEKVKAAGLKDVAVVTGTENEVCIYKQRIKLYRFAQDQWKERGIGNGKLMRHGETKAIRFVMRQEKTLKPVANFHVSAKPSCEPVIMNKNEKQYMWACMDFSDGQGATTKLAAKFQSVEAANEFVKKLAEAQQFNADVKDGKEDKDLVFADTIEDVEEKAEDDIDTNKTADADGEE